MLQKPELFNFSSVQNGGLTTKRQDSDGEVDGSSDEDDQKTNIGKI